MCSGCIRPSEPEVGGQTAEPSLLRQRDFALFISGRAISEIGSRITREGLPIVAILLTGATAPALGVMAAVSALPYVFMGPLSGVLADRRHRRPILIAADLARAALLLTIPASALMHVLSFVQILAVAFLAGALTVTFRVADQAWLPGFVSRSRLSEGNGYIGAASGVGEFVGPSAMGALIQWLGAPLAIAFDAFSYLASALSLWAVRKPEQTPEPGGGREPALSDAIEALGKVRSHPLLGPIFLTLAVQALFGGFFEALYEIYALRTLHLNPFALGLLITSGGLGALAAAPLVGRITRRFGLGPTLIGTTLLQGVVDLLIPAAGGPFIIAFSFLFTAQVAGDFLGTIFEIGEVTLRQSITPDAWLGRVNGSMNFASGIMGMAGALVGGLLGGIAGGHPAFYISALGMGASALFLAVSAVRRQRHPVGVDMASFE